MVDIGVRNRSSVITEKAYHCSALMEDQGLRINDKKIKDQGSRNSWFESKIMMKDQ